MKKLLSIAGSDSSGGAGIQADIKTFSAYKAFGMSVITAVTAQSTKGVFAVQDIDAKIIERQIDVIFEDIEVDGVKIGMVSKVETIMAIARALGRNSAKNVVLDPLMISKSGYHLLSPSAKDALIDELMPLCRVVTPNIPEAEELTGYSIESIDDMKRVAKIIHAMGAENVLIKGGHRAGDAVDLLYDGEKYSLFESKRIDTSNTHGTGCTLSSAITANMAKGLSTIESVREAKGYITGAIKGSFSIGDGPGPVHHFHNLY